MTFCGDCKHFDGECCRSKASPLRNTMIDINCTNGRPAFGCSTHFEPKDPETGRRIERAEDRLRISALRVGVFIGYFLGVLTYSLLRAILG